MILSKRAHEIIPPKEPLELTLKKEPSGRHSRADQLPETCPPVAKSFGKDQEIQKRVFASIFLESGQERITKDQTDLLTMPRSTLKYLKVASKAYL